MKKDRKINGEGFYLAPTHPEVDAHLQNVITELLQNYNLDNPLKIELDDLLDINLDDSEKWYDLISQDSLEDIISSIDLKPYMVIFKYTKQDTHKE